jgi:hypothetical protein
VLDLSAAAIDVVRRVNAVLAVRAAEQEHARATRTLTRVLAEEGSGSDSGQALTVPADFQEWAAERAARLAEDLRLGGYAVHGSLERIVPAFDRVPVQPDRDTVLNLVLTACIRLASTGAHGRTKGRDR